MCNVLSNKIIGENQIVRTPLCFDQYGHPRQNGLFDPEIFGNTQTENGGITVFGDIKTENVGYIKLVKLVVNVLQIPKIAELLEMSEEDVASIVYYEKGIFCEAGTESFFIDSVSALMGKGDEEYSKIISGAVGIIYLLSRKNAMFDDAVGDVCEVIPPFYRKCGYISEEECPLVFDRNNINNLYRDVIISNLSLNDLLNAEFHPLLFIYESLRILQKSVDALVKEAHKSAFYRA